MCQWDKRNQEKHYIRRDWPLRKKSEIGLPNVEREPLVPKNKIILLLLHIKLDLIKDFATKLNLKETLFLYLKTKFPKLEKSKEEFFFFCPQI